MQNPNPAIFIISRLFGLHHQSMTLTLKLAKHYF